MHEHFPFSYALIRSLPDDPGFARPDFGHFIILSGFVETEHVARSWSSLFDSGILTSFYSYLCTFLDFCILDSVFIPVFLYDIIRGCLYVILQCY